MLRELVGAHGLTRLSPAQADHMLPRRCPAKVMIESDYAVNFGTGQIESLGNHRNRALGDISQCRLNGVQHLDERPGTAFQLADDAEDGFGVVWG